MKKTLRILTFSLLVVTLISLSGCAFLDSLFGRTPLCQHEIDAEVWENDADKHWHECGLCHAHLNEDAHRLAENADIRATCTEGGHSTFSCEVCGYSYSRDTEMLGHDYEDTVIVPETCLTAGLKRRTCLRCGLSFEEIIPAGDGHDYQGGVCVRCGRDKNLDYWPEFDIKGNRITDTIPIDSQEEMISFMDYIIFHEITSTKYVSVNYTDVTNSNISSFNSSIAEKSTGMSWPLKIETPMIPGKYHYIGYSLSVAKCPLSERATVEYDDGVYANNLYSQHDSIQFRTYPESRSADFDEFSCAERDNSIRVSSSDQLFYAFEHGYNPIPERSSDAERMLNLAKAVNRRIIDDKMSDSEKIIAIYRWFVKEISYDNGAFNYGKTPGANNLKCKAWYTEGVLENRTAVCDGISKTACILAGLENIICVRVASREHAWNKVYLDADGNGTKEWTNVDFTWANLLVGGNSEIFSLKDLFFTDAYKVSAGEVALNYTGMECAATESINMYSLLHYGSAPFTQSNDYEISSRSELSAVISEFKTHASASPARCSLDIFITFVNTGSAAITAVNSTGLSGFSYISPVEMTLGGKTGIQIILIK